MANLVNPATVNPTIQGEEWTPGAIPRVPPTAGLITGLAVHEDALWISTQSGHIYRYEPEPQGGPGGTLLLEGIGRPGGP